MRERANLSASAGRPQEGDDQYALDHEGRRSNRGRCEVTTVLPQNLQNVHTEVHATPDDEPQTRTKNIVPKIADTTVRVYGIIRTTIETRLLTAYHHSRQAGNDRRLTPVRSNGARLGGIPYLHQESPQGQKASVSNVNTI